MAVGQFRGEVRGTGVEGRVAQDAAVGRDDGRCVRSTGDLPAESLGDGGEAGFRGGSAPVLREGPPVRRDEFTGGAAATGCERVHAPPQQLRHRLDVLAGEPVRGVLPQHVESVRRLDHGDRHRALGLRGRPPQGALDAPGQAQRPEVGVLQDEQEVERCAVAGGVPAGQDVGERHLLVSQHLPCAGPGAGEVCAQVLAGLDGQGQQHGVRHHADAVLELAHRAARDRRGDARADQAGHAVQAPGEHAQQDLEPGEAELDAHSVQLVPPSGVEGRAQQVRPRCRARVLGGQGLLGLLQPPVEREKPVASRLVGRAREPVALPQGEVHGGRSGCPGPLVRGVAGRQVVQQDAQRPAVDGDVVQVQQERAAAVTRQPAGPEHTGDGEVEGLGEEAVGKGVRFFLVPGLPGTRFVPGVVRLPDGLLQAGRSGAEARP